MTLIEFVQLIAWNEFVKVPPELREDIIEALLKASRTKRDDYRLQADGIYLTSN